MIRVKNSLNPSWNMGWKLPIIQTGYTQHQDINPIPRINEGCSGYGVLPPIRTSGNQSVNTGMTSGQSVLDLARLTKVTSYSQLRSQWLMVKKSPSIPQTIKDQMHEIYLEETTNHLNQLVFGDQVNTDISAGEKVKVYQSSGGTVDRVPKPPAYPRSRSSRRYRRIAKAGTPNVVPLTPVMEQMSARHE